MPEQRNYCRQLLDESDLIKSYPEVAGKVSIAVKFVLPDGGVSIDDFELRALGEMPLNLPYQIVALETAVGKHPATGRTVKAIVLCEQTDESIRITPFSGMADEEWSMKPGFDLPTQDYADKSGDEWVLRGVPAHSCGVAVWVLLFLNALACSNVHASKRAPTKAPKRGALPFDTYYVLSVDPGLVDSEARPIGAGRSPREHLRRGHIRCLADGRRIWVNATIVAAGSRAGRIVKDYRLGTTLREDQSIRKKVDQA